MFGIRGLWFERGGEPNCYTRRAPPEQRERRFHDVRDIGSERCRLERLAKRNARQGFHRAHVSFLGYRPLRRKVWRVKPSGGRGTGG
jgi:hypothetical protein